MVRAKTETGYKTTELGAIPSNWDMKYVKDIGEIFGGLSGKSKADFQEGNCSFIPYTNVFNNFFVDTSNLQPVNIRVGEKQNRVEEGDVIFTGSSETANEVGMSSVLLNKNEEEIYLNSFCFGLRTNKSLIDPLFSGYLFRGNLFRKEIFSLAQGSTRFNISKAGFSKLRLVIPPIKEQKKIAEILVVADEQVIKTDQLIGKSKELKESMMQQLFTRGIGHSNFNEASIGELPESWKTAPLQDISKFITKGSTPTTYGFEWQDEGIFFFKSDVVKNGKFVYGDFKYISTEAHQHMLRSQIQAGDILMTITGNIGRVAIVPPEIKNANINQHVARISVERSDVNPLFVFYWLSQPKFIHYYNSIKTGLAYPQISLKQVRETIITLPPLEEQEKIIRILLSLDEQINVYEKEKEIQLELKKALMQQLLTGKLRVTV